jgi:purine-nucleoside phosphorylase
MPVHLRAAPGDYAEACLLPGDPLRAQWIAETFLSGAVQVNAERALYGYTGEFEGTRVSVQATGMGCPSTAIVVEELAQLGVRRLLRVGTCGAVRPELALGELVVALSAVPQDGTTHTYVPEPHCPTADWDLLHGLVHAAKELGERPRVGPIVSSDVFYDPDEGRVARWADRGLLAVEMESAVLFTLGALRGLQTGCLLVVSDQLAGGERARITDDELRGAVERMTLLALRAVTSA